jgi:tetratricopeptide (TPR) repeat protein
MFRRTIVSSLLLTGALVAPLRSAFAQEFVRQRLLVHNFESKDRSLGRRAADEINSVISDGRGSGLELANRGEMLRKLETAGFNPDSVLLPAEIRSLAREYRTDEYVIGRADPVSGRSVRITGYLVLTRDSTLRQPIPLMETPNLDAAARAFGSEVLRARAQLIPERRCENALRAGQPAAAATAAREGIRAYPRAAIARVCLLRAYEELAQSPDSVLRTAWALLDVDSASIKGWEAAAAAYDQLGHTDSAGRAWSRAATLQRRDASAIGRIVMALMSDGNDSIAKPFIIEAVKDHPEDKHLAGLHWRVLLATADWANAVRVGEALPRLDDSYETQPEYFLRMATSYRNLNQPFRALASAAEGVALHSSDADLYLLYTQLVMAEGDTALARGLERFPSNGKLLALDAQFRRRRGDVQGALAATRRAVARDSTLVRGNLQLAQAYLDVGQPDSALAVVAEGLRTAADSALAAQFTLARGNTLYQQANASHQRRDFELALRYVQLSERLTPSANAGFLVGSAAFGVAQLASTEAASGKSCPLATSAEENLTLAEVQLARHGGVAPDAARQILEYAGQLRPYVTQQVQTLCGSGGRSATSDGDARIP